MDIPRLQATSSPGQRAGLGFLIGASVFAVFSFAAPLIEKAVSPTLCALPPGRHFPSGACVFFTALLDALWIGPGAMLALFPAIQPMFHSTLAIRVISDITVGLLSAFLFALAGIRKGAMLFVLSSILLVTMVTLLFTMFVVMF